MTNPLRLLLWTSAITVTIAALELGQTFFGPVVTALVFGIILSPLVNWFESLGVRPAASSLLSVLIGVACAAVVVVFAEPYVSRAIEIAPRIWFEVRSEVQELRRMLLGLDEMVERVESTVNPEGKGGDKESPAIDVPTARDALVFAPRVLGQMLTFIGVLYFFLMTRPEIFAWLGRIVGD
ncbi:MAG: AI-2E family transporter, partial [Pseudopelagicola sp.]|nr:AI-2E family transporter [Pseudopelagicola sp.]